MAKAFQNIDVGPENTIIGTLFLNSRLFTYIWRSETKYFPFKGKPLQRQILFIEFFKSMTF